MLVNKFAYVTGGADRHCIAAAAALRAAGHDVATLSTASDNNVEHDGAFLPLTVTHGTRNDLPLRQQANVAARAMWNRDAAREAERLLDVFRPDVVHAHKLYPQISVAPLVVAARRRVPVVQTLHDFELIAANPLDSSGRRFDTDEARLTYRLLNTATFGVRVAVHRPRVNAWIAVSQFLADAYAHRGIRATVVPNFVVSTGGHGFRERSGVLYLGRLSAEKGVRDLIPLARANPEIEMTVAGSGPLEAELRAAAADVRGITFLGQVDETRVPLLLAAHRVAVVPSHCDEGGPLVAVEAMAAGTPVVAYDRGGLGEYVRDAAAGALVDDLGELISAVAKLARDAAEWTRASESGLRAVADRHSTSAHVRNLEEIYGRVIGSAE